MGNTPSTKDNGALDQFYSHFIGKNFSNTSVTGGAGGYTFGGYSALEDYGNSVYSTAKEKLIRGIAKDVSSMLKVSSSFADTADIKDIVSKLERIVPNPKDKKVIKTDSTMHKDLCMKLAESINKNYNMNIIDKSADPAVICNKVSEIMYSLFTGLHTEFLTISGDVSRILSNLQVLQEYVDSANKKLIADLEKNYNGTDAEVESIKVLYHKLSGEIERQHTILANITDSVIGPVGESLITILEDNDDFAALTTDLKKMTGTPEFGTKLGYLLSGTSSVAYAAQIVDKALKKIGMSVAEYKSVKDMRELREKVYHSMVKQHPSGDELYKLLVAADLLYKNDLAHDDIVAYLEKKKGGLVSGGSPNEHNMSLADEADIATNADRIAGPFKGRTQLVKLSLTKQIDQKRQLRKQLFVTLNGQVKDIYDKIKYSLTIIGKKIGGEIELSPELDIFIRQLNNFAMAQPDKQNIHLALSGYRKDINSAYVKYQFMENLEAIAETSSVLAEGPKGAVFKGVRENVVQLIALVDEFNKTFTNTLSDIHIRSLGKKESLDFDGKVNGGDYAEDLSEDASYEGADEGADEGAEDISGGMHHDYESMLYTTLGGVTMSISESEFNHYKTMQRSIREIDYYYRIAGVKQNMERTAGEFENNTENYENILGEEAGYLIDQIQLKYNGLIKAVETEVQPGDMTPEKLYAHNYTLPVLAASGLKHRLFDEIKIVKDDVSVTDIDKAQIADYVDGYKFLLEYTRSSKIEMLEAAQALDIYLSKFTQSIQFKPDQIKEFVQILEQIEIVAKWFTDKSGDNLVGVFESFTPDINDSVPITNVSELTAFNNGNIDNPLDGTTYTITEDHYYARLANKNGAGQFYKPRMMTRDQSVNFVKQIEKSIKSVRALENIIATFSRINTDVSAEVRTFMSSGLMFRAFMKYCVSSVISVGYLVINDNTVLDEFIAANSTNVAEVVKSMHAKMAVGLRFNKDEVKCHEEQSLVLCDPLDIVSDTSQHKNNDICDNIFEMSVKSLISKVFTVVGTYNLFNKPAKDQSMTLSLATNPLRQILGGSEGGVQHVNIITDATELYIRLPLLAEWYRSVFEFSDTAVGIDPAVQLTDYKSQGTKAIISMIPDMESIWGPLCKVVFMDAKNITDGAYPAEYANKIIESVNTIYRHYNDKKKNITCREILNEFVLEINRRYGFIMREEINLYFKEKNAYIDINEEYPSDDRVDYDILDVESQIGRKPAPSDKFRSFDKTKTVRTFQIQDLFKTAKRFRQSIEQNLMIPANVLGVTDADFRTVANISLTGIISETQKKITRADKEEEKYQVVHEQLHGIEKFGDIDQAKMLIFHETVVAPLTVLYFTYLILNDFNKFCVSLNPDGLLAGGPFEAADFIKINAARFKGANNTYKTRRLAVNPDGAIADNMDAMFNTADYAPYRNIAVPGLGGATIQNVLLPLTMETLLRKVMNIGCDMNGLTDVYFIGSGSDTNYPVINYDKLEEVCTVLFNDAKASFHKLRKYLPASIIKRYESLEVMNVQPGGGEGAAAVQTQNRISLFYIQDQLFDRLFANKYGNGLTDGNIGLKNIYLNMTKNYGAGAAINKTSFDKVFSKIGFWEANAVKSVEARTITKISGTNKGLKFPYRYIPIFNGATNLGNPSKGNQALIASAISAKDISPLVFDEFNSKIISYKVNKLDPTAAGKINAIYLGDENLYNTDDNIVDDIHGELGLITKLNNIIYKYLAIFMDESTHKIYRPLVEKFATGHNAKDILNGKNINDNVHNSETMASLTCRTEPKPNAVLFASLANTIKSILMTSSDKISGTTSAYMEDNFLNINEYQKELMRANLPAFEKELNLLIKKADFMRRCLEETGVDMNSPAFANDIVLTDNNNRDPSYTQANKLSAVETNDVRKSYLIGIFNDISASAKSLLRCITDVQKDLNDVPMYFETYNESVIDYEKRNGHLPLMPISNVTHLMNFSSLVDSNEAPAMTLLPRPTILNEAPNVNTVISYNLPIIPRPETGVGSPQFKFTYGTRGLLHYGQEASLKFAPGAAQILDSYNNKMGGDAAFDKHKMESVSSGVIQISRWVIDYMYHNQVLCTHNWRAMQNLLLNNQRNDILPYPLKDEIIQNLTCQTGKMGPNDYNFFGNTSNVVLTVENDNYKQSMYRFMSSMNPATANKLYGKDRATFRIYNILDLNIAPINIHAMQREVPFVNLFNYAYTFDHMVKNFVGSDYKLKALQEIGGELSGDNAYTQDMHNAETKPEDTMVRNLIYPLGYRRFDDYINNTFRIMSGSVSINLNRPKYLSDQLWNKVLLNSLYNATADIALPPRYRSVPVNIQIPLVDITEPLNNGILFTDATACPKASTSLSYLKNQQVVTPLVRDGVVDAQAAQLGYYGYIRYNSKLVRWTEWFIQLQRVVRLVMRTQLEFVQDPVAQGSDAISEVVTEYKLGNSFNLADYE